MRQLVHLSSLPGADTEDNLSPFDKSPSSSMSKIILNILGLSLRARSVTDFSPLKDHLSELVGYSSPKSPEGRVLGVRGQRGIQTIKSISKSSSSSSFLKWGRGRVDPGERSVKAVGPERRESLYWAFICHLSSIWSTLQYCLILMHLYFLVHNGSSVCIFKKDE